MALVFVTATRLSRPEFLSASLLGRSLGTVCHREPFKLCLFERNTRPLGACYNQAIDEADPRDLLVFLHDDVHLDDWMVGARVEEALGQFDLVGVAGNRRRQWRQGAWYLQPGQAGQGPLQLGPFDSAYLSGSILHGQPGQAQLTRYGPTPAPVKLLDGVFLAARAERLKATGVRFDPSLGFHFYDLDLCRSAEAAGLRLGTWPIAITHASSGGSINSSHWADSFQRYLAKHAEQ